MKNYNISNYKIIKTLNKGAFAQVYQAIDLRNGSNVAIKVVSFV